MLARSRAAQRAAPNASGPIVARMRTKTQKNCFVDFLEEIFSLSPHAMMIQTKCQPPPQPITIFTYFR
jgi:hypothetical protein